MFVGDGANDELAGAERVGMQAVLVHRAGEEPPWDEVRGWQGPRITAIPQVMSFWPTSGTGSWEDSLPARFGHTPRLTNQVSDTGFCQAQNVTRV